MRRAVVKERLVWAAVQMERMLIGRDTCLADFDRTSQWGLVDSRLNLSVSKCLLDLARS